MAKPNSSPLVGLVLVTTPLQNLAGGGRLSPRTGDNDKRMLINMNE